ncbi:hypothetical protein RvY_10526 [Ramazzottius varieornatus]|uniref:JmjC domain-containing protein n=1 Tax=Ramazzottius varieornatus TaxID=947166 RepID=A0A1D1VFG1_RAMVA|nr:hypothetical protein RvY_10526 [Ramazzottius varieornatus]
MAKQQNQTKRSRNGSQSSTMGRRSDSEEEVSQKDKVDKLTKSYPSSFSNVQFILSSLAIATAVYLITKSIPRLHHEEYIHENNDVLHPGRPRDHRYEEAHPDGPFTSRKSSRRLSRKIQQLRPVTDGGWRNASEDVWASFYTDRCDVVRKSALKMNGKKFEREYREKKPLLLEFPGGANDWTDADLFSYANLSSAYRKFEKPTGLEVSYFPSGLEQYITQSEQAEGYNTGFPFDTSFFYRHPMMSGSMNVPEYLNASMYDSHNRIFFTSKIAGVSFAAHSDGWTGLVYGAKRWFLYPPTQTPPGGPSTDIMDWFYRLYPNLSGNQFPMECVQRAGEILYIPAFWYHASISIGDTVSVGFFNSHKTSRLAELSEDMTSIMRDTTLDEAAKLEKTFPVWLGLHKELPTNTEFLNRLGELYGAGGDYNRALWMLEEAVMIDPMYQAAFINLAKTYFATGNRQKAQEYFEQAADIDAYSADICRVYGEFLVMQKQYDQALQWFEVGETYHPSKAEQYQQLQEETKRIQQGSRHNQ